MNQLALVELEGVDVHPDGGTAPVVRAVDWRIGPGECWVVGGGPGTGKSSLLATAAGLYRPGNGRLRIFGRDLAEATEDEQVDWRRRIGFVFAHGGRLFSQLNVTQNIALPLLYHLPADDDSWRPHVEQALARAELTAVAQTMPSRLNIRQQQRVSLLRALVVPTEILFLDNPFNGLGPRDVRWWVEQLQALRAQHVTIVATCDDYRYWLPVADRFGVIENQRFLVIEDATTRELL